MASAMRVAAISAMHNCALASRRSVALGSLVPNNPTGQYGAVPGFSSMISYRPSRRLASVVLIAMVSGASACGNPARLAVTDPEASGQTKLGQDLFIGVGLLRAEGGTARLIRAMPIGNIGPEDAEILFLDTKRVSNGERVGAVHSLSDSVRDGLVPVDRVEVGDNSLRWQVVARLRRTQPGTSEVQAIQVDYRSEGKTRRAVLPVSLSLTSRS